MLSESFVGVFLTTVLACGFGLFLPKQAKDRFMPIVFGFVLWSDAVGRMFASSLIWYYSNFLLSFIGYAYLLGGLKMRAFHNNGVLVAFFLFFLWFGLGTVNCDSFSVAIKSWIIVLRMILCGLSIGQWAVGRPDGIERTMRWIVLFSFLGALLFVRQGNWNAADLADAGGRLVVDDEKSGASSFNANAMALHVTALIVYPFIYLLGRWQYDKQIFVKLGAFVAVGILALVTLKTGSRNGGLVLGALALYFLTAKTGLKKIYKIMIAIVGAVLMMVAVARFFNGSELRSLEFVLENEKSSSIAEYGAGRVGYYMNVIGRMDFGQKIWGAGAPISHIVSKTGAVSNLHSMYVQIFYQSGSIGICLLIIFCMMFFFKVRKCEHRSSVLLLCSLWLLTGIGESSNIKDVHGLACYALGMSIAFCGAPFAFGCRKRAYNQYYDDRRMYVL